MTEYDLLVVIQQCEQMVQDMGLLPMDIATVCINAYDSLKDMVADGDYLKYREWFDANAERILREGK